jgi:membrane-associated protein
MAARQAGFYIADCWQFKLELRFNSTFEKFFEIMFDSDWIIRSGGLLIMALSVFCQTGLFFCFFVPSGVFLFTAGVFVATGDLHYNLFIVCSVLIIASVLGNVTGYWLGWKAGAMMYKRSDSRFFKKSHLDKAEAFYKKYGNLALAGGLFFPIIRTFSPVVAGIVKLNFRRFVLFTFIGSVLWISTFVIAGYLVGIMPVLKQYLKYIVIGIILVVTTPVVIGIIRNLNKAKE